MAGEKSERKSNIKERIPLKKVSQMECRKETDEGIIPGQ